MFNFGISELILLGAIALLVIGPKQLPEVARTVAKFINDFRRTASEFTKPITDVRTEVKNIKDEATQAVKDTMGNFVHLPDDEDEHGEATHFGDDDEGDQPAPQVEAKPKARPEDTTPPSDLQTQEYKPQATMNDQPGEESNDDPDKA